MKQYPTYKDSGIQWIGQIPKHWNISKLKNMAHKLQSGGTPEAGSASFYTDRGDGIPWVTIGDMSTVDSIKDTAKHITEEGRLNKNLKIFPKGTLLYSIYATIGKVSELACPATINQAILAISLQDGYFQPYCKYALKAQETFVVSFASANTQANLNAEKVSNFIMPVPPLPEQQAIAQFLDSKTAKIDETISLYEQQKTDLVEYRKALISDTVTRGLNPNVPLKESGIQWLGQIPEGWKIVPLKFLLASGMMYGANESADEPNMEWPRYIRITDIAENGSLKDETYMSLSPDKAADYMLQKGDILFARSGATVGKTYMFNENYPACFAGYLIKATCGKDLLPEFLLKYTQSSVYENWKNSIYIQSTIQNIGADKYNQMPIPVPSLAEQQAIVSFLDSKTAMIDEAIRRIDEQIADLKAYRTALITDAVTGKIDVRKE